MSAALGAILDKFNDQINDIHFIEMDSQVETILLKNDFLTYYGKDRAIDTYQTTIKFKKLKPADIKYFKNYVKDELLSKHGTHLPKMSTGVHEKIVEAIYEIFVNAQIHSETNYIYTCGQFFPNKETIEFTIVDTGLGFKNIINRRFGRNLNAIQALEWAVEDTHTTKINISGGIGLALLKEFVDKNKGKMQIISNEGFYQYDTNGAITKIFRGEFPGTIVNLQFNTNDRQNYSLTSEIDINDIF